MANNKHMIGMAMGVVILVLDAYWTWLAKGGGYTSVPFMLGVGIFIAALVWLWADM